MANEPACARHVRGTGGAGKKIAWKSIKREKRWWWYQSHIPIEDRILENQFFRDNGLVSLSDKWQEFQR